MFVWPIGELDPPYIIIIYKFIIKVVRFITGYSPEFTYKSIAKNLGLNQNYL